MTGYQPSLEAQYRRMLRWYPHQWRAENGEALIGTLLDLADAEGRRLPRRQETLDLVVNGIAARLAAVLPPTARDAAASFAFATGLAWTLVYFVVDDWKPLSPQAHALAAHPFGPFNSGGVIVTALWVVALLLIWWSRPGLARIVLLGSAGVALALVCSQPAMPWPVIYPSPDAATFYLLLALAIGAAAGRPRLRLPTVAISVLWIVALSVVLFVLQRLDKTSMSDGQAAQWWYDFFGRLLWYDLLFPTQAALVVVMILIVAAVIRISGRRTIAVAVVLATVPWAVAVLINVRLTWVRVFGDSVPLWVVCLLMGTVFLVLSLPTLVPSRTPSTRRDSYGSADPA